MDYNYLISADECDYRKEVYYDALDFFRGKHMEDCVVQIQNKMLTVERQCSSDDCVNYYMSSSLHAWIRQSYYLTIELGKLGFEMSVEARKTYSDVLHTAIIGESYYHIGNYSDAQMWLKRSLQIANETLKDEYTLRLRYERLRACFYLLMSGDLFNVFCYGYIIKDFTILLSDVTLKHLYTQYKIYTQQPPKKHPETLIFSTDTDSLLGLSLINMFTSFKVPLKKMFLGQKKL